MLLLQLFCVAFSIILHFDKKSLFSWKKKTKGPFLFLHFDKPTFEWVISTHSAYPQRQVHLGGYIHHTSTHPSTIQARNINHDRLFVFSLLLLFSFLVLTQYNPMPLRLQLYILLMSNVVLLARGIFFLFRRLKREK